MSKKGGLALYKNWLIGILAVLLVVVGYFWSTTSATERRLKNDLRAARSRVTTLEKKATRPAGTTAAPGEESRAGVQKDPVGEAGCAGCHKKVSADKDYSMTAELKRISGHPTVSGADTKAPKVCVTCHKEGKNSLANVLHKPHLTGDAYKKQFDTNCLGCHGLKDGTPVVKNL